MNRFGAVVLDEIDEKVCHVCNGTEFEGNICLSCDEESLDEDDDTDEEEDEDRPDIDDEVDELFAILEEEDFSSVRIGDIIGE